ncbi:MAG: Hpt domain-containing protein [Bacteroidota bacterium]|nr:Hpt domain-containing protein [Bacteroidota bacterium]
MAGQFTYADLTYLESMSMGSQEMVNEMIQIFLDQIPEFTDGLKDNLTKEDFIALGALAHKAKSSVAVMGMDELSETLKKLEVKAKAGEDADSYPELINTFINQVEVTEKELMAFMAQS